MNDIKEDIATIYTVAENNDIKEYSIKIVDKYKRLLNVNRYLLLVCRTSIFYLF